jgi:hypothetical protein
LAKKDFVAFITYLETTSKKYSSANADSNIRVISALKRDLTATFQECMIDACQSFPSADDSNTGTAQFYRINILATSNKIIYYDFGEKEFHGSSLDNFSLYIIDSFRNSILLADLKRDFFNTYRDSLNQQELFNNANVYGSACSVAPQKPEMRAENDVIVEIKNVELLTKWLQSTNTERQVYGIDGLYQLKKKGYILTAEQLRLINIIKNKKGYLNICRGCKYLSDKTSRIVNLILAESRI